MLRDKKVNGILTTILLGMSVIVVITVPPLTKGTGVLHESNRWQKKYRKLRLRMQKQCGWGLIPGLRCKAMH